MVLNIPGPPRERVRSFSSFFQSSDDVGGESQIGASMSDTLRSPFLNKGKQGLKS